MDIYTLCVAAAGIGLLGSLHCLGMCGPIAVALGSSGPTSPLRMLLFVSGKALTYVAMGVLAGTIGAAFGNPAFGRNGFAILAIVAGVVMVAMGTRTLWRRYKKSGTGFAFGGPVDVLLKSVLKRRPFAAPLVVGLLTGLLPCGLVYAAVAESLTAGSALGGAAIMAAFGLGTAPSMFATGLATGVLSARVRSLGEPIAAGAVVAVGLMAAYRGIHILMAVSEATASCCHHGG